MAPHLHFLFGMLPLPLRFNQSLPHHWVPVPPAPDQWGPFPPLSFPSIIRLLLLVRTFSSPWGWKLFVSFLPEILPFGIWHQQTKALASPLCYICLQTTFPNPGTLLFIPWRCRSWLSLTLSNSTSHKCLVIWMSPWVTLQRPGFPVSHPSLSQWSHLTCYCGLHAPSQTLILLLSIIASGFYFISFWWFWSFYLASNILNPITGIQPIETLNSLAWSSFHRPHAVTFLLISLDSQPSGNSTLHRPLVLLLLTFFIVSTWPNSTKINYSFPLTLSLLPDS